MNNLECYNEKIFDSIKQIDEEGKEFWFARELSKVLGYTDWRNFKKVIEKAKSSCMNSNNTIDEHVVELNRVLNVGNNAKMTVVDYKLSRYACYLIVQNADPNKEVVALGQTYFAVQTRKMKLTEAEFFNLVKMKKDYIEENKLEMEINYYIK